MLQALIAYAEREHLGDPDFEPVGVRWLIPLDGAGRLAGGPIPLSDSPDTPKPKPRTVRRPFTSLNELNQGDKSHFLCDSLERATLLLDARSPAARRVQHEYFKRLLSEAAVACPSDAPALRAVITFLESDAQRAALHQQLAERKAKPGDNATFAVDGVSLLDLEGVKAFWRLRRRAATGREAPKRRVCLATGQVADTLDTTEKIKGVPGALPQGANLISFDKEAFCSFGLEQAQNAALSAPAELKIRSALNRLIEISRDQRLVFHNTVCLHWTREPVAFDPLDLLASGDPEGVERLLKAPRTGREPIGLAANAYYATSLSGNGARIVVRDWLESTVPEVQRNVAEWFQDLSLVPPEGVGARRGFGLAALLRSLVRAELAELPPQVPAQLLHGALCGRSVPLPQSALAAALRRQQLDRDNKLNPARLALIKACLLRSADLANRNQHTWNAPMTECLNPESRDPAYLCGRLFAVFDRLQYLALGGVNAGVVERYYASASATPALVMGRLFRNAQFHLAKTDGGVATNVAKDFEAIAGALGDQFPAALDLEGQGRFALGYYHQKADYRRRTAERKELEAKAEAGA